MFIFIFTIQRASHDQPKNNQNSIRTFLISTNSFLDSQILRKFETQLKRPLKETLGFR